MAQVWRSLLDYRETFSMLKSIIIKFRVNEIVPDEWNIGRLTVLLKKGVLSLPNNYRGIMLLEIACKIIAIGVRSGRGCTGAIFTIKMTLKRRREHGLESWVLFLDLVKAFDRIPREMFWKILAKFGVPNKLVSLLKVLLANFVVKFAVNDLTQSLDCIIGVKQGDVVGPILFTFFIAAAMIIWKTSCNILVRIFHSKMDATLTGRSYRAYGESYPVLDFEYADDTAIIFQSRANVSDGVSSITPHFARFGTEIHTNSS